MADVPRDLLQEIKKLEEMFTVPKEKLKEITDHFVSELTRGNISVSKTFHYTDIFQVSVKRVVQS